MKILEKNNFKPSRIRGVSNHPIYGFLANFLPNLFGSIIVVEAVSKRK